MPRSGPGFRHEVVQAPKPTQQALVASSRIYQNGPGAQSIRKAGHRSRTKQWQSEAWDFYDTVPEYRFGCSWVGNLLSKATLEAHQNGKPTTNQHALDAMASLFGGVEGQEEMLRLLGINFTVAGEGFLIGKEGYDGDEWDIVAAVEVNEEGGAGQITVEGERIDDEALAIRLWKAHPRKTVESDSPSRALLPILTQINEVSQVISAQAASRLTGSGILWVPDEMELPSVPVTTQDGDDDTQSMQDVDGADGLTQRLIRIASIAIQNRSSAAANIPLVVAVPGEYIEKIQHTEFWSGFDENAKEIRDELIRRLAIGMDMPPEVITGTADVNHWGTWGVEEASIKAHAEPLLAVIVASLSTGYLQPYLKAMGVEDYESYTVEANTAALRLRPNRSKEAFELWDRGVINERTLLIENGFDPDSDTPDEREKIMWFLRKVASGSTTPDQVAIALEQLGVKGIPGTVEDAQQSTEAPSTRTLREHPTRSEPNPEESEAGVVREITAAASAPVIVDGLVLACEAHVHRALERAGNKLKVKVGPGIRASAADLYLSAPGLEYGECEELLSDAWSALDRFEYPGVSTARLRDALQEYALFLLRTQKPMTRPSLARHLMLELADAA